MTYEYPISVDFIVKPNMEWFEWPLRVYIVSIIFDLPLTSPHPVPQTINHMSLRKGSNRCARELIRNQSLMRNT